MSQLIHSAWTFTHLPVLYSCYYRLFYRIQTLNHGLNCTLLDKLQLVESNSLTKLHKRGQNPHGESHQWASSCNYTGFINQSVVIDWITKSLHTHTDDAIMLCSEMYLLLHFFISLSAFLSAILLHTHTHQPHPLSSPALPGVCFI